MCDHDSKYVVNGDCHACSSASLLAIKKVLFGRASHECVQPTTKYELAELAEWSEWSYSLVFPVDYFIRIS